MSKKSVTKIEEIVEQKTGEIVSRKKTQHFYDQQPPYIKLFLSDLALLFELTPKTTRVMLSLLPKVDYENEITLNSHIRAKISKELMISRQSLSNSISELMSKSMLFKKANNYYTINPNLFARGDWSKIKELRMRVKYNKEGRQVLVEADNLPELPFEEQ